MLLAYHGATSVKCDLSTDVTVSARAGYRALELWAAKVDSYLTDHSGGAGISGLAPNRRQRFPRR